MSLFTSTSTKEFEEKVKQYSSLINEEKLDMSDIIKKKQYVQICNLQLDQSNHKYSDLAQVLNVCFKN